MRIFSKLYFCTVQLFGYGDKVSVLISNRRPHFFKRMDMPVNRSLPQSAPAGVGDNCFSKTRQEWTNGHGCSPVQSAQLKWHLKFMYAFTGYGQFVIGPVDFGSERSNDE